MSHVDEGTLHAYLDGELSSTERVTVDAHLAQCNACRATLAEERALLERASTLLGAARPVERPAPPFEQLRRVPKRPPWAVRMGFAWAATIAVALGIGYYLRSPENAVPSNGLAETQRVALDQHRVDSAPVPAARTETRGPAPQRALPGRRAERDEHETPRSRVEVDSPLTLAQRPRVYDSAMATQAPQLRDAAPSAAEPAPSASIVVQEARGYAFNFPITTQWQIISRGTAASMLGTDPVGLPGLTTRRIQRSPTGDGTVVVEQALDSATVIQFFQRPAVALSETDSLARAGAGYTADRARSERQKAAAPAPRLAPDRLARFVGRLRVEISGPLTTDSLNKLLEQVKPLEP